jgi:hypothetical protein
MREIIRKMILLISMVCIPAMATTFEIPSLSGYREYRVKVRCQLNDTNYPDAVDEVKLPDGSILNLSYSRSSIPEPAPSIYGLFFKPGQIGDTVITRFSNLLHWDKGYGITWIDNNPDSIWAEARRYPAKTDSTDWMVPTFSQPPIKKSHGKVVWVVDGGSMSWPYNPGSSHTVRGYRGIIYGSTQAGPRFKIQVDSVFLNNHVYVCCGSIPWTYNFMVAEFLYLRIGYDATGQGNFENPISVISQQGKKRIGRQKHGASAPYFSGFDGGNFGYQTNGRRVELNR